VSSNPLFPLMFFETFAERGSLLRSSTAPTESHSSLDRRRVRYIDRRTTSGEEETDGSTIHRRIRFVRAGAVFVWEEEEAGIRRWTDHIKWSRESKL
jgi:hypothetical protein